MSNTKYSELRTVQYPCLISGEAVDRFGLFLVDFDHQNKPIRADSLTRMVGHETPAALVELLDDMEKAILERETLTFPDLLDLDHEEWNGQLYWPRVPVLR